MATETKVKKTKAKWTPGPWYVSDFDKYSIEVIAPWNEELKSSTASGYGDYRGIIVCNLPHQNDNPCVSKSQAKANAHVIAAAPEMAYLLRQILNDLPGKRDWLDPDIERRWREALKGIESSDSEGGEDQA